MQAPYAPLPCPPTSGFLWPSNFRFAERLTHFQRHAFLGQYTSSPSLPPSFSKGHFANPYASALARLRRVPNLSPLHLQVWLHCPPHHPQVACDPFAHLVALGLLGPLLPDSRLALTVDV